MKTRFQIVLAILAFQAVVHDGLAQGTAFTYQGRLNVGANPANGNYDLTFTLYGTNSNGVVIAGPVTNSATAVSNGLFTTLVDFGPGVFIGASNWLAIAVRTNGSGAFTVLNPGQELTPMPYAIFAQTAAVLNNGMGNTAWTGGGSAIVGGWNNQAPAPEGGAFIGGGANNYVSGRLAVIGGGDSNTNGGYVDVIGGGEQNSIFYPGGYSFIGGGILNSIPASYAVIGGGEINTADARDAVVAGGSGNVAAGIFSAIGGGSSNTTSGEFSTVPGGTNNAATGDFSFAAGNRAKANNTGSFVWADSQNVDFSSTTANQFNVRASGGVRFVTGGVGMTIDGVPALVGSGGGGIAWQNVTGSAQQAQPNNGYVANNAAQAVTITLPAAPNIGDIVRVSGAGAGGWQIAQNASQSTLTGALIGKPQNAWVQTTAPASSNWNSVASSADGGKLVAVVLNGGIYTSTNSGLNWTKTTAATRAWWNVASSSNGNYLFAAERGGGIWISSNSGSSWAQSSAPSGFPPYWNSVACSADGSHLIAAQDCACYTPTATGGIWTSANFGTTWTQTTAPLTNWSSVASSTDGRYLYAVVNAAGGGVYASTDYGVNWNLTTAPTSLGYWGSVTTSADGSHVVAANFYIYASTNYGATWAQTAAPSNNNWSGVASSADGTRLIGAQSSFGLWTSTDSGQSWSSNNVPNNGWRSAACSANGNLYVAAQEPGGIYISTWWATTTGTTGGLAGGQGMAIELQYVGNGQFISLSHEGTINSF